MKYKKYSIPNNMEFGNRAALIKSSNEISLNQQTKTADKKRRKNNLQLRLNEVEEINGQLENRIEQDTVRLNEVIERNAKFLSIIAHDLRNPFNSIIGILDILGENIVDYSKDEIEKLIHIASSSAINTYNLLENLLAWSLSQNKEKNFNPIKIDLNNLILNELDSFGASAVQKKVKIDYTVSPNLYVTADIQMVKTIFRNLISNAIKYSYSGGVIYISAKESIPFVEISIEDNGVGMTQNTQRKLFKLEEFQSTIGTGNEHGTGLGLLFCKEFVEMHSGKIWIESEPGKGSKFKFTLPHYI